MRKALTERLQWTSIAIDEHRRLGGGWNTLCLAVSLATYPMLIESIAMPWSYRAELELHDSRVLVVRCMEGERIRRGGEDNDRAYDYEWPVLRTVDTTNGIQDIQAIAKWCKMGA